MSADGPSQGARPPPPGGGARSRASGEPGGGFPVSAAGPSQGARPRSGEAGPGRLVDDIAGLRRVLAQHRTIAVVGLSANWYRPSYFAAKYMLDHGYRVIPVNPAYGEVLGQRCYPSIAAIPGPVDIVDAFRKPAEMAAIAREAVAKGAKVLWMQLGIRNDEAARIAMDAGLDVVADRCVKIEHARILGGLNWCGVNTGVVSSHRAGA